jgi:O-Glycosyl hydrolase
MKIIITNPGRTLEERSLKEIAKAEAVGPIAVITDQRDQSMYGFGAALTEASCVLLNRLEEKKQEELLEEIYSPAKSNFSIARICVGSSDYAQLPYSFAPKADDMEMEYFDASHDSIDILPILQIVRAIHPDLYLFSSPWSPPGWMKTSGQLEGGFMRSEYIHTYALYYLKFLQYYRAFGITINALTPQNESETDQVSRMPACIWHPDMEMQFAKDLRSLLDKNGFEETKIWLMDHNFNMWGRASYEMDDPTTKASCAGIAWHPYEGYPEMMGWFRRRHPECENHWTEGEAINAILTKESMQNLTVASISHSFLQAINNGCQSITTWNLALDEAGYPNIGPFDCKGTIEISRDGSSIRRTPEYYALTHFAKYLQKGARRIILDKLDIPVYFDIAAFENPDHSMVVIVSNTNIYDSDLYLCINDHYFCARILRESVNTILL